MSRWVKTEADSFSGGGGTVSVWREDRGSHLCLESDGEHVLPPRRVLCLQFQCLELHVYVDHPGEKQRRSLHAARVSDSRPQGR